MPTLDAYLQEARKRWPDAISISGNGRYATIAACNGSTTVCLWRTSREARAAKQMIDSTGCGGRCHKSVHSIADLHRWMVR
jgi:hypothetical protein